MKKILLILVVMLLCSCNLKTIDWTIPESDYVIEDNILDDNYSQVVVLSKMHNTETDEKYVEVKYYLDGEEAIRSFILSYSYEYKDEIVIEELIDFSKSLINIETDDYFVKAMEDLKVQDGKTDRGLFGVQLNALSDYDPNARIIITISNGNASFEKWNDRNWIIENGTKDNFNIESKAYFGYYE